MTRVHLAVHADAESPAIDAPKRDRNSFRSLRTQSQVSAEPVGAR